MGAVLVSVSLVTVRTLGAGGVVAATVSGQLVVSAILDQFGFLGLDRVGLTPARLLGFALLLGGTALVTARWTLAQCAGGRAISSLRLPFRAPFDGGALLAWLAARAVPGVEEVDGDVYRRSLRLPRRAGRGRARLGRRRRALPPVARGRARRARPPSELCRRLLDLDADPVVVAERLGADPLIGPLVRAAPGLRVPGSVDGAELAVRAVLGQQVSVAAARTGAGRLVAEHGEALAASARRRDRALPGRRPSSPRSIPRACPCRARAPRALVGLCRALADGELRLDPAPTAREARRRLLALPGIGPWTAGYVAMRALGDPDVFLAEDLGVRHALRRLGGPDDPRAGPRPRRRVGAVALVRLAAPVAGAGARRR